MSDSESDVVAQLLSLLLLLLMPRGGLPRGHRRFVCCSCCGNGGCGWVAAARVVEFFHGLRCNPRAVLRGVVVAAVGAAVICGSSVGFAAAHAATAASTTTATITTSAALSLRCCCMLCDYDGGDEMTNVEPKQAESDAIAQLSC